MYRHSTLFYFRYKYCTMCCSVFELTNYIAIALLLPIFMIVSQYVYIFHSLLHPLNRYYAVKNCVA